MARRPAILLLLVSACATLSRTPADDRLFIDSHPQGAAIIVNGVPHGLTPQLVSMPGDRTIRVQCRLAGHEDAEVRVSRELAPATALDNPLFAAIDEMTGAAWRLQQRTLFVELTPAAR